MMGTLDDILNELSGDAPKPAKAVEVKPAESKPIEAKPVESSKKIDPPKKVEVPSDFVITMDPAPTISEPIKKEVKKVKDQPTLPLESSTVVATSDIRGSADLWLSARQNELTAMIEKAVQFKSFSLEDPSANLSKIHVVASSIRENQTFVRTLIVKAISFKLEAQRNLDVAFSLYNDEISSALITFKEEVANARSYEEREIRLRKYLKTSKEKESWQKILRDMESIIDLLKMVYEDLSRASMTIAMQVNVIKQQILIGELKVQLPASLVKSVFSEDTLSTMDRVAVQCSKPGDNVNI